MTTNKCKIFGDKILNAPVFKGQGRSVAVTRRLNTAFTGEINHFYRNVEFFNEI